MYKNKIENRNNLCGVNIKTLRKNLAITTSQKQLADTLQILGLDIDKNAIQRIESGSRFVTDIELSYFAKFFNVSVDSLLKNQ